MKRLWIAALLLAVLFGATLCNNLRLCSGVRSAR